MSGSITAAFIVFVVVVLSLSLLLLLLLFSQSVGLDTASPLTFRNISLRSQCL